ncbi:MAG: TRAP transporter substrate-binding protein [Deltaproteobacteria bacterium]|nr:TRAP transporter substrate-binding protein [Deltaproteobacteria bacterium]
MRRSKLCRSIILSFTYLVAAITLLTIPRYSMAKDRVIELKYAVLESAQSARTVYGHAPWAKMLEKATGGRVKVTVFPSASLAGARQVYDATINGLVDIAYVAIPHYPGRFPLSEALIHPGSNLSTPALASKVAMKMYRKYPQMQAEYKQVKFLFMYGFAPISTATVKKPIRTVEDVKGLRLRVAQKGIAELLKSVGASPMFIKPGDIFLNLQKGVIDGSVMGWSGHRAFGTIKLAKYFTEVPAFPGPFFFFAMNKNKWNKLPVDVQKAIMSVSGDTGSRHFAKSAEKETELATKDLRNSPDKEIITLSKKEIDRWTELSKPIQEKMISRLESKGLPGREFFEDIKKLVAEYKK